MKPLNIGLIGLGLIGKQYLQFGTELKNSRFVAISGTRNEALLNDLARQYQLQPYASPKDLMDSGLCDAVLIAIPHPLHCELTEYAATKGIHVLVEKPLAISVSEANRMLAACNEAGTKLAVVFQQRTIPVHRQLKALLDGGAIGKVCRVSVIATDWFRPQAYYANSSWRGTWKGEGGGILMNQAPHVLDLLEWLVGHPTEVTARVAARHDIETEDTAEAYLQFANGATGHFFASTAELPGQTAVELFGDRGKIELQNGNLRLYQMKRSLAENIWSVRDDGESPGGWIQVPPADSTQSYVEVIDQFADVVHKGDTPIASGQDGFRAVELANAMLLSAHHKRTVQLPLDPDEYDAFLAAKRGMQ